MTRLRIKTGLIFASWAMLLIFGCHKKKPPVPPEESPPTLISEIPIEQPPDEQPPATPPQEVNNTPPEKPPQKPPKHSKPHPAPKKPEPETPAPVEEAKNTAPPSRVMIQEAGPNSGSGPAATGAPGSDPYPQNSTQQLLDSTENNLRNLKRQLSAEEQSLVGQIQDYINESKKATQDGDNVRARNLALKARLLSDELVKGQ